MEEEEEKAGESMLSALKIALVLSRVPQSSFVSVLHLFLLMNAIAKSQWRTKKHKK